MNATKNVLPILVCLLFTLTLFTACKKDTGTDPNPPNTGIITGTTQELLYTNVATIPGVKFAEYRDDYSSSGVLTRRVGFATLNAIHIYENSTQIGVFQTGSEITALGSVDPYSLLVGTSDSNILVVSLTSATLNTSFKVAGIVTKIGYHGFGQGGVDPYTGTYRIEATNGSIACGYIRVVSGFGYVASTFFQNPPLPSCKFDLLCGNSGSFTYGNLDPGYVLYTNPVAGDQRVLLKPILGQTGDPFKAIACSESGSDYILEYLDARHAIVDVVGAGALQCYQTIPPENTPQDATELHQLPRNNSTNYLTISPTGQVCVANDAGRFVSQPDPGLGNLIYDYPYAWNPSNGNIYWISSK